MKKIHLFSKAMPCPLCSHARTYKHGKTSQGSQRYPKCKQTFTDTFDRISAQRAS